MPAECIFIRYSSGDGCGVGRVVTVRSRGPYMYIEGRMGQFHSICDVCSYQGYQKTRACIP